MTLTDKAFQDLQDLPKFKRVKVLNADADLMAAYQERIRQEAQAKIDSRQPQKRRDTMTVRAKVTSHRSTHYPRAYRGGPVQIGATQLWDD